MKKLSLILFILIPALAVLSSSCDASSTRNFCNSLQIINTEKPVKRPNLVVVTHGWIEKGQGTWVENMATAIDDRTDSNSWLCGYFDWSKGARTINATTAAKNARDTEGPKLAEQILQMQSDFQHIHMIAHSSGCWAISEAAKILAKETNADIHLTFFDAYVSLLWDEKKLGDVNMPADANFWIDHYYTRDYTLGWTQYDLSRAHNIDITKIDQRLKDHNFPWKWYHATITGKYPKGYHLDDSKLVIGTGKLEYGFARGKETGDPNSWNTSTKLSTGNKAIKLDKQQ
ncbi:hypothetical protein ACFL3G_04780 [Planctomycetota bacterium]